MADQTLAGLRQQIDTIDDQILDLLNRRATLVIAVGKAKAGVSSDFYVPSREQAIYARLIAANAGPFPEEGVRRVFREIISASLSLEQPLKVAFLGPQATFTHVAARSAISILELKWVDNNMDEDAYFYTEADTFNTEGREIFSVSTTFPWGGEE